MCICIFELTTDITRRRKRSETSRDGKIRDRQSLTQIVSDNTLIERQ